MADKQNYMKNLKIFHPKKMKGYIEFTVPVLLYFNQDFPTLKITDRKDCYRISCKGNLFRDLNQEAKLYFNHYMENDGGYHYDMKMRGHIIYKDIPKNYSVRVAVSEFVRFFSLLDEYILKNELTAV